MKAVKALIIKLTRWFINITLIETSVLALYLLVYYLIRNPPLLCTSSWRFEISLLSLYGWFRVVVSFFECVDQGAGVTRVTIPTARYLALGKFLKNS
jgi:hypothetical protein